MLESITCNVLPLLLDRAEPDIDCLMNVTRELSEVTVNSHPYAMELVSSCLLRICEQKKKKKHQFIPLKTITIDKTLAGVLLRLITVDFYQ